MKKFLGVGVLGFAMILSACGSDEYADLRKMTVTDFVNDRDLMLEVRDKCHDREIKDADICDTVLEAINENHKAW